MAAFTAPQLFARSLGIECTGSLQCFYCGAPCHGLFPVSRYVKDSFTGRDGVVAPGSKAVCEGCVLCLREACDVPMLDGTIRTMTKCAMRSWSWLITEKQSRAGSKANLALWREACLYPPEPPFAVVLSDSGQKHLLYRGVVNHSSERVVVTLETERVEYAPPELAARMRLTGRLIAATGKPALDEPPKFNFHRAVMERYRDGEQMLSEWDRVRVEPLSRLAAWLSANREDSQIDYPSDTQK